MRIIAKTMVALGMLSAAAIAAPTAASAQGFYVQGPGFQFGVGSPYYGRAWAYHDPRWMTPRYDPRMRAERGMHHWDPYGLRWD